MIFIIENKENITLKIVEILKVYLVIDYLKIECLNQAYLYDN